MEKFSQLTDENGHVTPYQVQMTTDLIDCPFQHDQKRMCVKGDITARFLPSRSKSSRVKVALILQFILRIKTLCCFPISREEALRLINILKYKNAENDLM